MFLKSILFFPEYDELLELLSVLLSVLQEIVLEQFNCIGTTFRILVQAPAHEILEGVAPFGILETRCFFSNDQVEHFLLGLTDIRRFTIGKL